MGVGATLCMFLGSKLCICIFEIVISVCRFLHVAKILNANTSTASQTSFHNSSGMAYSLQNWLLVYKHAFITLVWLEKI